MTVYFIWQSIHFSLEMLDRWFADAIQSYRLDMTFMLFYYKLKLCIARVDNEKCSSRNQVVAIVNDTFGKDDMDTEEDIAPSEITLWKERSNKTYSPICESRTLVHLPLSSTNRKKDALYRTCLGYIPKKDQLPKNVDLARALSMGRPPPNLPSKNLWKCFGIQVLDKQCIVINTIIAEYEHAREYYVCDSAGLVDFCNNHDKSAGEVFSSSLWCTAITFDIDGKTYDARLHSANKTYPLSAIKQELLRAMRDEMLHISGGRWDVRDLPPTCHIWKPSENLCDKLSLRVSFHLPSNVAFECISDLSSFVDKMCRYIEKQRCHYLCLLSVKVDGVRFEKSHVDSGSWISIDSTGQVINLTELIESRHCTVVETKTGMVEFTRGEDNCFFIEEKCQLPHKLPQKVMSVHRWIANNLDQMSETQCLVDSGIYHNNKSLRLPLQSKFVNGQHLRRFVSVSETSTVLDALIHYPHSDMNSIGADAILLSYRKNRWEGVGDPCSDCDVEQAKNLIEKKYNMVVTKLTERNGNVFMDVQRQNGENYCLIKEDTHSSAHMYFILNRKGNLTMGCWSDKCRQKQKMFQ